MTIFISLTTSVGARFLVDPRKISVIEPYLTDTLCSIVQIEGVRYPVKETVAEVKEIITFWWSS